MDFSTALDEAQNGIRCLEGSQLEAFLDVHPFLVDMVAAGVAPEDAIRALDDALDEAIDDYVAVLLEGKYALRPGASISHDKISLPSGRELTTWYNLVIRDKGNSWLVTWSDYSGLDFNSETISKSDAKGRKWLKPAFDKAGVKMEDVIAEAGGKHDPFKHKSELTTDAAVIGLPNPRGKAKNRSSCKCSNYVCTCTRDDGTKFKVDMTRYYKSGDKAKYMDAWREITAKQG